MGKPLEAIAVAKQVCGCCHRLKMCGMYTLQTGQTAWVCVQCREGR